MALEQGQFSINNIFTWGGSEDAITIPPNGFSTGQNDWSVMDTPSPSQDVTFVGTDLLQGPTWVWDLMTNTHSAAEALYQLENMAKIWFDPKNRTNLSYSVVRYNLDGRECIVYGRPRRWLQSVTPTLWQGVTPAVADFKLIDPKIYDGNQLSQYFWGGETYSLNGGTAPAPFTVNFYNVGAGTKLVGPSWELGFNQAYSGRIMVDTRLQQVVRDDGVSAASMLTMRSSVGAMIDADYNDYKLVGQGGCQIDYHRASWAL